MIWLSSDLRFNGFGCQWIWDSIDLVVNWFWDSSGLVVNRCVLQMILVVCWFELQVMRLSIDLRFKRFGCQSIWDSSDLVVNRFEIQVSWLSMDLRFKWLGCQSMCGSIDFVCQLVWDSSDSVVNWSEIQVIGLSIDLRFKYELVVNWFEIQVIWMSNDLRFKWFGFKLMCDSNDFVKRSFSARLPSKTKLWSSKTKLFCETSFKSEALKLKNEAFLRDFLQKRSFEAQKRSFSARLPSKMKLWSSKTTLFCETSFKNDMSTKHLASEFQYVLAIFD